MTTKFLTLKVSEYKKRIIAFNALAKWEIRFLFGFNLDFNHFGIFGIKN